MPYEIKKVRNKSCYKLINKENKHVFSKCGSLKNVKKQMQLLNAIKYNKNFKPNKTKTKTKKHQINLRKTKKFKIIDIRKP